MAEILDFISCVKESFFLVALFAARYEMINKKLTVGALEDESSFARIARLVNDSYSSKFPKKTHLQINHLKNID